MKENELLLNRQEINSNIENQENPENQNEQSAESLAEAVSAEIAREADDFVSESNQSIEQANDTIGLDPESVRMIKDETGIEDGIAKLQHEVINESESSKKAISQITETLASGDKERVSDLIKNLKLLDSSHSGLSEVIDSPNIIVRKEKFVLDGISSEGKISEITTKKLAEGEAIFSELRDKYGASVPEFKYVIADDPDKVNTPCLFTVTEKINGDSLENVKLLEVNDLKKIDNLFDGIIKQLQCAYEAKGPFWLDAEQSQVMFGIKEGDTEKQPYITDLEPRTASFELLKNPEHLLLERIWSLLNDVESLESRAQGSKLTRSREAIRDAFDKIPKPAPDEEYFGTKILPAYEDISKRLG